MKLYEYHIDENNHLACATVETADMPKTYYPAGGRFSRILKSQVGTVMGKTTDPTVYLLEEDRENAENIFADFLISELEKINTQIRELTSIRNDIAKKIIILGGQTTNE